MSGQHVLSKFTARWQTYRSTSRRAKVKGELTTVDAVGVHIGVVHELLASFQQAPRPVTATVDVSAELWFFPAA
jgi:hypothetical protein